MSVLFFQVCPPSIEYIYVAPATAASVHVGTEDVPPNAEIPSTASDVEISTYLFKYAGLLESVVVDCHNAFVGFAPDAHAKPVDGSIVALIDDTV